MTTGAHYLELKQLPIVFEPIDRVESAFFDQSNFQMFCVQHGFTDVRVKGLTEEDSFKVTIPARGPVSTIKFSGGTPRILSIQRRKSSVEFINIFAENSTERSLPLRNNNHEVIGFHWVFKNEYVVLVLSNGVELYQCNPYRMSFKMIRSYNIPIAWAVFSPEERTLLVCSRGVNVLYPFVFREGIAIPMIRLPKFEIDLSSPSVTSSLSSSLTSRDSRVAIMERDVVIMRLYGVQYLGIIRNIPVSNQGAEVLLYQVQTESPARLAHILSIDISGRFTLSVVDNLVIVHHQTWKTSMIFDIANEGETVGTFHRHQPILAPLSIAPTKLEIKPSRRSRSSSAGSHHHPGSSISSSPGSLSTTRIIIPELYSQKWVFFQPNIIVDAQHGVIWKLSLDLDVVSSMMSDKCQLLLFLLMREFGKEVILSVCRECLEPGRQANLGVLGGMFDQMNHAYKLSMSRTVEPERKYRVIITQKDVYTQILVPYNDRKDMPYKYLVAVLVEYIRSLNKLQIPVEHFLFEMVMNILIENKCFYQLHQFLQYHVISDSKALACLLLSRELVYSPATQLAMDMFKRLSTADSEIIDILLSRGQILSALRYVKAVDKVDTVSARQFLEAAANEDDRMLFYTVYKFFEERNIRLRRKPDFPADEQCQPYEAQFKKWFGRK